jgi:hypothetical protein
MLAESVFTLVDVTARGWMKEVYDTINYLQELWLHGLEIDGWISALARELEETERTPDTRVMKALDLIVPGRRFCIAESVKYAIVSSSAHEDGKIYVPLGCLTPMLLRREGMEHRFVGEAYMQKYMHDLAIDELDRRVRSYETVILV